MKEKEASTLSEYHSSHGIKEIVNNSQIQVPHEEFNLYYLHFRPDAKSINEEQLNHDKTSIYDQNNYFSQYFPNSPSTVTSNMELLRMGGKAIQTPIAKNIIHTPIISLPVVFPHVEEHNTARDSPDINQDQLFEQAEWLTVPKNGSKKRLEEINNTNPFVNFNVALFAHNMFPLNEKDELEFPDPLQCSERKKNNPINDEIVPQSMEEIYQLSNQNRKRNKEKKKLKEDSSNSNPLSSSLSSSNDSSSSSSSSSYDDSDSSRNEEGKGNESSREDTQEFLRKIGWISSNNNTESFDRDQKHRRSKSSATYMNNSSKEDSNKDHSNVASTVAKNGGKKYLKPKIKSKTFPIYDYSHQKNNYGDERGYSHSNSRSFIHNNNINNNNNSNIINNNNMNNNLNNGNNNMSNSNYNNNNNMNNNNIAVGRGNRSGRGKPRSNNNQVYKMTNNNNYNNSYNYYNNNTNAFYNNSGSKASKYQGPQ